MRICMSVCQAGVRDLGQEAGVAALQEEPGVLHAPNRQLQLGEFLLVAAEVRRSGARPPPERSLAGVFGAGFGGGGRIAVCR
jgi:hypothetical protein